MLSPKERQKLIDQIREFPAKLEKTVNQVSDSKMDTPYGEGKWAARQVVHHLVDSHMNGYLRVRWALTEHNPTLKPYDQDDFAELPDYEMDLASSFMILHGLHEKWAYLCENLTDEQWLRPLTHPESDYTNIEEILTAYVEHGEKHLGHIKRLIKG
ncbi:MAG: YfiT family bacillithiol transferase [Candidatus Zixiibacteriota bacterium]